MSVLLTDNTKVDEEQSIKPPNLVEKAPQRTLNLEGFSLDFQKQVIRFTRKLRIAEMERLQAEVNALDQRIAEIEVEEMKEG